MPIIASMLAGLIFGLGLIVADMTDPAKVLSFLDLAGAWDPSLVLVLVSALIVCLAGFTLARRRTRSLLGLAMQWPTATTIDRRLVLGSLSFGIGWGLAGFCPGPALAALGMGEAKAIVFVAAMLAGMGLFELMTKYIHRDRQS